MLGIGKMFNAEFTVGVQNDLGRKDVPNGVVWASEYFWVAKRDQGFVIFSHIGGDDFDHGTYQDEQQAIDKAKKYTQDEIIKLKGGI